jgi:hypothetical protein
MWPPTLGHDAVRRWHEQGFVWSDYEGTRFGLLQRSGGPCGVLAVVQAHILKALLFSPSSGGSPLLDAHVELRNVADGDREEALIDALCTLILQARGAGAGAGTTSTSLVVLEKDGNADAALLRDMPASALAILRPASAEALRGTIRAVLPQLQGPRGVLLFMLSMLMTRGMDRIREDMDEPGALTAEHGHCTQELMNLLLTGVATSQVFDGSRPLGDTGLVLRGVSAQPSVGFLTYLEAMRYCQVGSFLKSPMFPIYVIGSASHVTVLFCRDANLVRDSDSEALQRRVKRAFDAKDACEGGFIQMSDVRGVLQSIEEPNPFAAPAVADAVLRGADPDGLGICLWQNLWGVLDGLQMTDRGANMAARGGKDASNWEQCCRNAFNAHDSEGAGFIAANAAVVRTVCAQAVAMAAGDASAGRSCGLTTATMSDDVAKAFTAACDMDSLGIVLWDNFWARAQGMGPQGAAAAAAVSGTGTARGASRGLDFELRHYNGMCRKIGGVDVGPSITAFRLTRFAPGEIGRPESASASKLERTLRTCWKGAAIDWMGAQAPSIDG